MADKRPLRLKVLSHVMFASTSALIILGMQWRLIKSKLNVIRYHLICVNIKLHNGFLLTVYMSKGSKDYVMYTIYRSGTVNSNTVNSKFHLIRSCCKYLARFLSFHV